MKGILSTHSLRKRIPRLSKSLQCVVNGFDVKQKVSSNPNPNRMSQLINVRFVFLFSLFRSRLIIYVRLAQNTASKSPSTEVTHTQYARHRRIIKKNYMGLLLVDDDVNENE